MHERISISSICLLQYDLPQQASVWRELGTSRVGLVGMQVEANGIDATRDLVNAANVTVETIMFPFLAGQTLADISRNKQPPRDNLMQHIDIAGRVGSRSIYMVTGGRGQLSWEQAAETFAEAIAPCVDYAKEQNICLMIENAPPAYADIHIAHSLRDTLALAQQAKIQLCIDLPGCWTEAQLDDLIQQATPHCGLVQLSDYVCGDRCLPARAVPGDGDMPLLHLLGTLLEAGYQGAFELELIGERIEKEGQQAATARASLALTALLNQLPTNSTI